MIPNICSWLHVEGTHIALDELGRPIGYLKSVGRIARVEHDRALTKPLRPPREHPIDRMRYEEAQRG
jgi:hypothetical protein